MEQLECRNSLTRLHLPEDLIFEILLRLPAKSVARFRCVSSTWLFISTSHSFIIAHARRTPISMLYRSIAGRDREVGGPRLLFSLSARDIDLASIVQASSIAKSSCDGVVLFWRKISYPFEYYILNFLTGLMIDINPTVSREDGSRLELFYHRWTGQYRLINLRKRQRRSYNHLDAEVLSLAGTHSWRKIKAKAPFVSLFDWQSGVLVNDRLYWTCEDKSGAHTILIFNILNETFSLMELPSYTLKIFPSYAARSWLRYGLLDIEGSLCCWIVYRYRGSRNVMIDVWAAVDGNDKWKNTYSLCLVDEGHLARRSFRGRLLVDSCFWMKERGLIFLFDNRKFGMYFLCWDLKSGKCWTELVQTGFKCVPLFQAIAHKETLVNVQLSRTSAHAPW